VADDYLERLTRRPVLPEETERRLVAAAQAGDAAARAELVEAFMPLIAAAARPYRTLHVQRLELLQEGVVGLLRALDGFEPERGLPFWPYASWWVRQAMQHLVAELTRPVVLSDRALRSLARLRDAHAEVYGGSGREPSHGELAERTGLSVEQVDDLMATERPAKSLEEPLAGEDGVVGIFGDLLEDPLAEGEYERVLAALEAEELHAMLAGLSHRERDVLRARYGLDGEEQSLREVGRRLGLSYERVRQIEQRALGKLAAG
jgi:RNA polymerase primary sigma factor